MAFTPSTVIPTASGHTGLRELESDTLRVLDSVDVAVDSPDGVAAEPERLLDRDETVSMESDAVSVRDEESTSEYVALWIRVLVIVGDVLVVTDPLVVCVAVLLLVRVAVALHDVVVVFVSVKLIVIVVLAEDDTEAACDVEKLSKTEIVSVTFSLYVAVPVGVEEGDGVAVIDSDAVTDAERDSDRDFVTLLDGDCDDDPDADSVAERDRERDKLLLSVRDGDNDGSRVLLRYARNAEDRQLQAHGDMVSVVPFVEATAQRPSVSAEVELPHTMTGDAA